MIVFDRILVFMNEPQLNTNNENSELEMVYVKEHASLTAFNSLTLKTDWVPISGQAIRYHSTVPFHEAKTSFSWVLEVKDVVTLLWDAERRAILYHKRKGYTPQRLRFWVLHTFLPLVLELERSYRIMHVGAVEVEGKPICFSAFSFGGKSTLTDYFLKQGHPLLSDDSLGIEKKNDTYYAIPSYPFHRPYREVETLGYYTENFTTDPKPLHAVFSLEKVDAAAAVEITELKGIEKFKAFHYSSFIDFDFMKKERFEFFTEMAKYVPVYRIGIPWDLNRLDEVYETIVKHVK